MYSHNDEHTRGYIDTRVHGVGMRVGNMFHVNNIDYLLTKISIIIFTYTRRYFFNDVYIYICDMNAMIQRLMLDYLY